MLGLKPSTSLLRGVCSTAVLQPQPWWQTIAHKNEQKCTFSQQDAQCSFKADCSFFRNSTAVCFSEACLHFYCVLKGDHRNEKSVECETKQKTHKKLFWKVVAEKPETLTRKFIVTCEALFGKLSIPQFGKLNNILVWIGPSRLTSILWEIYRPTLTSLQWKVNLKKQMLPLV